MIIIDPKNMNGAVKGNKSIMPSTDDNKPELSKAKVCSVLDVKDGFH